MSLSIDNFLPFGKFWAMNNLKKWFLNLPTADWWFFWQLALLCVIHSLPTGCLLLFFIDILLPVGFFFPRKTASCPMFHLSQNGHFFQFREGADFHIFVILANNLRQLVPTRFAERVTFSSGWCLSESAN